MIRDDRDEENRRAHERGERFCLRVEWMPSRRASRDWFKRCDAFAFGSSDIPEPVTVYVPVNVISADESGATVGPYLNSRPLAVPWRQLTLARLAPEPDPETLRQVVDRWGLTPPAER
jgi:hypothetical protein